MVLALIIALVAAQSTPAPPPARVDPTAAEQTADGLQPGERKIKVVCRNVTKPNSRFVKRDCREVNADARQTDIDQQAFRDVQNQQMVNGRCMPVNGVTC